MYNRFEIVFLAKNNRNFVVNQIMKKPGNNYAFKEKHRLRTEP